MHGIIHPTHKQRHSFFLFPVQEEVIDNFCIRIDSIFNFRRGLVEIIGFSPINPIFASNIATSEFVDRAARNVNISARQLTISDAGFISSSVFGDNDAGNININVNESIVIKGSHPNILGAISFIGALTIGKAGNSGEAIINTSRLSLIDGGQISTSSLNAAGNAGNVTINATESIVINLDNSQILATSQEGCEGNISIAASDLLELRNGSQITTQAGTETGGGGDGGDINLDSNNIVLLENSQITANAFEGPGGNINITTQGLFESPDSEITASSAFCFWYSHYQQPGSRPQ